jgi:hypothetical protein
MFLSQLSDSLVLQAIFDYPTIEPNEHLTLELEYAVSAF